MLKHFNVPICNLYLEYLLVSFAHFKLFVYFNVCLESFLYDLYLWFALFSIPAYILAFQSLKRSFTEQII